MVVVATEFGRTARINGTEGTDHGTGTVALLAGGAVKGGPGDLGLAGPEDRQTSMRGRDLAPTTDLARAVIKGRAARSSRPLAERVLAGHGVSRPGAPVKAMKGLVGVIRFYQPPG